jgi:hypothetical protein
MDDSRSCFLAELQLVLVNDASPMLEPILVFALVLQVQWNLIKKVSL